MDEDTPESPATVDDFAFAADFRFGQRGLTKREYFSGLAMQALLSRPRPVYLPPEETLAHVAARNADALIAALEK